MNEGQETRDQTPHDVALVEIGNYPTPLDGAMAKARLEAHGIEGILFDTELATSWVYTNALGGVRLMVSAADEISARAVLAAAPLDGLPDVADNGDEDDFIAPGRPDTWCPACHAQDVAPADEAPRGWLARLFNPGTARRCRTCGHVWRTPDKTHGDA